MNPNATTAPTLVFDEVLTAQLYGSPTNPRKRFAEVPLNELAANILEMGVLQPLLVRPAPPSPDVNGFGIRYEIIAGERRFIASQRAGLVRVPVRIGDYSDQQVLEIQIVENGQREDLHPLEEADGYKVILDTGYSIDLLAEKVNKPVTYITRRLALIQLTPEARELFFAGEIELGHALLLCRVNAEAQAEAIKQNWDIDHGSWNGTQHTATERMGALPVKRLARWLEENVYLSMEGAAFDIEDAELVPAAGACSTCPKRSGNALTLFPDMAGTDTCTDGDCYQTKAKAHITQLVANSGGKMLRLSTNWNATEKGVLARNQFMEINQKKKKDCCSQMQEGVIVEGQGIGSILTVCVDKSCPKHFARSHGGGSSTPEESPQETREKRKLVLLEEKIVAAASETLFIETIKCASRDTQSLTRSELRIIALRLVSTLEYKTKERFKELMELREVKDAPLADTLSVDYYDVDPALNAIELAHTAEDDTALLRLILAASTISSEIPSQWQDRRHGNALRDLAGTYGVDATQIDLAVRVPMTEKFEVTKEKRLANKAAEQARIARKLDAAEAAAPKPKTKSKTVGKMLKTGKRGKTAKAGK